MKIILVLSNCEDLGTTGKKTGWYLPEAAHAHDVFVKAGFEVVLASPKGGRAPVDPSSVEAFKEDLVCKAFLENAEIKKQVENTVSLENLLFSDFGAVFYAGGHGVMFDMVDCPVSQTLIQKMFESGRVVAAVCHGPIAFVNVTLSSGEPLVKSRRVTGFTNSEEDAVQMTAAMPLLLETRFKELGGTFVAAADFTCNVQVSDRLVTGQNPLSTAATAQAVVGLIKK